MAIKKTISVLLDVREAPDFFPASAPVAYTVFKRQSAFYGLTLNPNASFTGRARLSITSPLPADSYTFSQPDIGAGETVTLTVNTADLDVGSGGIDIVFEEIV